MVKITVLEHFWGLLVKKCGKTKVFCKNRLKRQKNDLKTQNAQAKRLFFDVLRVSRNGVSIVATLDQH